jgi:hypothetical protein
MTQILQIRKEHPDLDFANVPTSHRSTRAILQVPKCSLLTTEHPAPEAEGTGFRR